MADDKKKTDDKTTTPAPGTPDPNPTVPATPAEPEAPDASIEPAAQAAAPAAKAVAIPPPLPADYEMPDDYASEQDPVAKVKSWVEAHPGLSVIGAAGIGLLAGRLVMSLIPDPEPPSLTNRVEKRAKQLQKVAKKKGKKAQADVSTFAHGAGDTLQDKLHQAAEALREAAENAGDVAGEGYEKTKDLAETIADAAKVAVSGVLASKIDDWVGKVRN